MDCVWWVPGKWEAELLCISSMVSQYKYFYLKSDKVVTSTPFPQKFLHPHPIPISFNPIPMKFIPILIKSSVLYISADNLTVYRRHKN